MSQRENFGLGCGRFHRLAKHLLYLKKSQCDVDELGAFDAEFGRIWCLC
jgi:hypothetical protein